MKGNQNRRRSNVQEKRIARRLRIMGATTVKGSGSTPWDKGDIKVASLGLLVEAKYTDKPQLSLEKEVLDKLHRESLGAGYVMELLAVEIQGKELSLISTKVAHKEAAIQLFKDLPKNYIFESEKSFRINGNIFELQQFPYKITLYGRLFGIMPTERVSAFLS